MVSCADVVYYLTLIACIVTGEYYKNIDDRATKRNLGTGLGILIVWLICGSYIIHSFLMVWGNIVIIKCCNKKYIHQLSFAYTWLYLIYVNYHMDVTANYVFCLLQIIALRLVGVAFEINMAEKTRQSNYRQYLKDTIAVSQDNVNMTGEDVPIRNQNPIGHSLAGLDNGDLPSTSVQLSVADVISYAYYFIGLHRGPYYRWKTFNEHLDTPFGRLGNCRTITEQKCKKAVVLFFMYIALKAQFPVQAYSENDLYHNHGTDYRYLYNIPMILSYVLQHQIVMMMCTSVCTEAGFGVYPTKTQPIPGHGPSTKYSLLNLAATTEAVALEQEYNFAMLRCFQNDALFMGPRMRDTLRGCNMSHRYWFWSHMYKNMLVKTNKEVRSAFSFVAWSLWCGPSMQQTIICSTLWVHLQLENEYAGMYSTSAMKVPWDIGFSIMRLFCLIYLTPCLILTDNSVVLRYYNSIYWVYHVILLFLILVAVVVQKQRIMSTTTL